MGLFSFGGGPSINTNQPQQYVGNLSSLAGQMGSDYGAARGEFAGDNAGWQKALRQYSNYLSTNPATQQYNATQVANAEQGANEGASRAIANTEQDLARRGISTKSGIGAGAIANINQGLATNNANIQNQVGQENITRYGDNMAKLASLWNGAADTSFGHANTLGNDASRLNQGLFDDTLHLSELDYQNDLNKDQAKAQLYGTLAKSLLPAVGAAFGGKNGGFLGAL